MLSHDNLVFGATALSEDLTQNISPEMNENGYQPEDMRMVSYLPLSHIAGLQTDIISNLLSGSQVYFARPDALQGTLTETLQWCRPTIFFTVPRVWEKFEDALKERAAASPEILKKFSAWAKGHGYAKVMA